MRFVQTWICRYHHHGVKSLNQAINCSKLVRIFNQTAACPRPRCVVHKFDLHVFCIASGHAYERECVWLELVLVWCLQIFRHVYSHSCWYSTQRTELIGNTWSSKMDCIYMNASNGDFHTGCFVLNHLCAILSHAWRCFDWWMHCTRGSDRWTDYVFCALQIKLAASSWNVLVRFMIRITWF